jgi:hypothetical protein
MSTIVAEAARDQLQIWYPQFGSIVPPREAAGAHAFLGRIQPFPDETEFAGVIAHLAQDQTIRVEFGGRLTHPAWCKQSHPVPTAFSPIIASTFEILLLQFAGKRHPRVYAVSPEISRRRYPTHPHLRDDQQLVFNGKPLQAICTYLSSDRVLERDEMQLVHVMDYTAMYLAKHVFWAATYRTTTFSIATNKLTTSANTDLLLPVDCPTICDGTHPQFACYYRADARQETLEQKMFRWFKSDYSQMGLMTWLGKAAPHLAHELIHEFRPKDECPCGSGERYGNCCWKKHQPVAS